MMAMRSTGAASVSLLAILSLASCGVHRPCQEPEPPFVWEEGVYNKFGDPVILAREECIPVPLPPPLLPSEGGDASSPPSPPSPPSDYESFRPQPDTPGQMGTNSRGDDNGFPERGTGGEGGPDGESD